jgi:transcriptional regulator with XRE-family HTH domain
MYNEQSAAKVCAMFRKSREEHSRTEEAFFCYISERIREARNERSMLQQELAHFLYKTGEVVSDIERGRVHVDLFDLSLIAKALDKLISYFFPPFLTEGSEQDLDTDERQLLLYCRKIQDQKLRAVAMQQVKSLSDVDVDAYIKKAREEYGEWGRDKEK